MLQFVVHPGHQRRRGCPNGFGVAKIEVFEAGHNWRVQGGSSDDCWCVIVLLSCWSHLGTSHIVFDRSVSPPSPAMGTDGQGRQAWGIGDG